MHICQQPQVIKGFVVALDKASRMKKSVMRQNWFVETASRVRYCDQCWRRYIVMAVPFLGPTFLWVDPRHPSKDCPSPGTNLEDALESGSMLEQQHIRGCVFCLVLLAEQYIKKELKRG